MQVERIKWGDTFGCPPAWEFEDEVEFKVTEVVSVGFIKDEDERMVVLVPHMSSAGRKQIAGHICIPQQQIIERKILASFPSIS